MPPQPPLDELRAGSTGVSALFPHVVAVASATRPTELPLYPEEEALLGRAVDRRRADFATGRACARQALSQLSVEPGPIGRGSSREPLWPQGMCGSITHCEGYWAAAVARRSEVRSIGLDAEARKALRADVLERVTLATERDWMRTVESGMPWDVLFFSAKESVYKAWFPLAQRWLGFEDAVITFDPRGRSFRADLLPHVTDAPPGVSTFAGRFSVDADRVVTAVVVPLESEASAAGLQVELGGR